MPDGIELATGYISIVTEGSKIAPEVKRQFGKVGVEADRAGKASGKRFGSSFGSGLKLLGGAAIGGGIISFLKSSNAEAREAQKVGARTTNVIKTTKGAANISAAAVGKLSTAISNKVGIDDEAIQSGSNLLLTFKNVRNEVGKGNKVFNRATKDAVDLSAAGFGSITGASKQLGKALNDPVKGIAALGRAGVTFTDQQKDQIKTLVKSGKTLEAQKIILKEVESQVGGSAAAQATAGEKAAVAMGNLKEQIGTALLPTVDKLATFTSKKVVPAVSDFVDGLQDGTGAGGKTADVLKDVYGTGKKVVQVFDDLPGPVKKFGVESVIALAVLSKFRSITSPATVGLSSFVTGLRSAETRMTTVTSAGNKLGVGLRNLAGAGGLIAVTDATNKSNKALGGLEGGLGGAAAGFAVGGPLGAGIGAVAGGLVGVFSSGGKAAVGISKSEAAAASAIAPLSSLSDSINAVSGAYTKMDRVAIGSSLRGQGAAGAADTLGLHFRTVVNAALGVPSAIKKVDAAIAKANGTLQDATEFSRGLGTGLRLVGGDQVAAGKAANTLSTALGRVKKKTKEERVEALQLALGTGKLGTALKRIPDATVVKIGTEGKEKALADIRALERKRDLSSKEIKLLLSVANLPHLLSDINKINRDADHAARNRTLHINTVGSIGAGLGSGVKPRATGGPVTAGRGYLVGEKRPEIFVPKQSGRIIPRVDTASVGQGGAFSNGFAGAITVSIDGIDMAAYMTAVAEDVVERAS